MKPVLFLAALILASNVVATVRADDCDPNPPGTEDGYRIGHYGAPVPDCAPGAPTIGRDEVRAAVAAGDAIFIDVTPIDGSDPDPFDGSWGDVGTHLSMPGATWLPEVGRGKPEAWLEDYFRDNLDRLTAEKPGAQVVIFCSSNCWGSWNAAKRAAGWGYPDIRWYPAGVSEWSERELAPTDPVPVEVE
ncbi:MAG: rhodanese-like domain-containing protein [Flavobacteriaceae bacterium]